METLTVNTTAPVAGANATVTQRTAKVEKAVLLRPSQPDFQLI